MQQKLGIAVLTQDKMPHVLGLAQAANKAGKQVDVFITGDGVHLTRDDRFDKLLEVARVGVCEVSYFARGYRGIAVPGLNDKDFVTQGRNAEIVEEADRYITL